MELSGLTRYVLVWHLTVLSLVSFFQVKLTGMFPDHEAPGHPIEATLSGLLCVRHSASHFVSTVFLRKYSILPMLCFGSLGFGNDPVSILAPLLFGRKLLPLF